MAKDNKIRMPQSGGGLIRYYDEYKSKLQINPWYVVVAIVVVVVFLFILHRMNPVG
ncbi:MAG: preprotein translocase subunit Sec61beta [Candidatus Woesearchaeota archaeon]